MPKPHQVSPGRCTRRQGACRGGASQRGSSGGRSPGARRGGGTLSGVQRVEVEVFQVQVQVQVQVGHRAGAAPQVGLKAALL